MSRLSSLKGATSLSDVARLLDFKPKAVAYILYKQDAATKYKTFKIPKRSGGHRTIMAPTKGLKLLQRRLAALLQDCVEEINVATNRKDRIAHGFKRGRSIITNARRHRRRRWIFNIDLEDYFPSINFGRVRGFLLKNRDFELHADVATVIAQIACHENSLPQGSPCSPVLSNLIAHLLDMRVFRIASMAGCSYSRYADDLTFSTNKRDFPGDIAVQSGTEGTLAHLWRPSVLLQRAIERAGFRINSAKTHMMYRNSRQCVTGLVVNEKLSVRWDYRHKVRAMVHRLVTTGTFHLVGTTEEDGQTVLKKRPGSLNELHGMLGFIDSIGLSSTSGSPSRPLHELASDEKVYREFLMYSLFYAAENPVVMCEGETDNVYLTHAIRSLAEEFPALGEKQSDGKIRLKVRLFKYRRSSTARLLGLRGGGTSALSKFIPAYRKETRRFSGPLPSNPVVILYDNDAGAGNIRSTIKQVSRLTLTGKEPFVCVTRNLYAMPTPLGAGKESKIEDLFESSTKATMIQGKAFSDEKDFDVDKYYGKKIFAYRVIRENAEKIDFSGFRPLLENLVAAIEHHKVSLAELEG